jgi:outer membrane protein assembly factor BamD (BamD/ComL family)
MLLLSSLLLAGCSTKSERLYRRAEAFLAQGQFEMAADEYRRLAEEHPRGPLADDALYKLAYIYAEELDRPTVALAHYRALVDNYGQSPWCDDALLRIMGIQRREMNDPAAVAETWKELQERFPDRKALCARGMLEVARAQFDAEQYALAAATANELTVNYADQPGQCAQAALLHARASERMGLAQPEVERLFELVIESYPETHAAAMAKRSIGWFYYEKKGEHEQAQAEEVRRRSRVISGVPSHAKQSREFMQALSAMSALLAHRGEKRSLEELLVLTGVPFVTVFDPERPTLVGVPEVNPLEAVATALGFAANTVSGTTADEAFETLHQALLQGHPVLVLYGSSRTWSIITGYDVSDQRVHFMPPGRNSYAAASRTQFLANWRDGSSRGSGIAGPRPFYQFSLGARLNKPSNSEVLRRSLQRAAETMRARSLSGAPAGEAAWLAAGAWLERCAEPEAPGLREVATEWAQKGLAGQLAAAQSGTGLLNDAASLAPELNEVGARYGELLSEARLVAVKIEEATAAEDDAAMKWQAAAAQANYVAALHARLADDLSGAGSGG